MKVWILALLPVVALGQLGGGITDTTLSASSEPVVFAVKAINEHFAKINRDPSHALSLLNVVHAKTQVVEGEKLYLTLHLTGDYYCDVNVWYRQWLTGADRLIITDGPTCTKHGHQQPSARVGGLAGGVSQPKSLPGADDHDHQSVLKALDFGTCAVNSRINYIYAYIAGDNSQVTYTDQVTAGTTYKFYNVKMLPTQCRNQGCSSYLSACAVNTDGGQQQMSCNLTVQFQAWMPNQYTLTDAQC